jgi:threonine/homoserine/homoserine lactone efflux protein
MLHIIACSLGVSAIVLASAELFTALKVIGAAYLIWLGFRTLQSARRDASTSFNSGSAVPPVGPRRAFHEGVLIKALNPKTAAFFLAFIPQFVDPTHGNITLSFVVLGFVSVALNTFADIVVAVAASGIREGAAARPALIRRLREASATAMIALVSASLC